MNKLAKKGKTIYSIHHELPETILAFYARVLKSTTSTKKRSLGILIPVWNCLRKKGILSIESIPEINIGMMMKEIHKDNYLFTEMVPEFFTYLHNRINHKYSTEENKREEMATDTRPKLYFFNINMNKRAPISLMSVCYFYLVNFSRRSSTLWSMHFDIL